MRSRAGCVLDARLGLLLLLGVDELASLDIVLAGSGGGLRTLRGEDLRVAFALSGRCALRAGAGGRSLCVPRGLLLERKGTAAAGGAALGLREGGPLSAGRRG